MNAIPLMQGTKLGFMLTGEMNVHTLTHSPANTAVVCMLTTPLDKQEAGALLRKRREALGLTQEQVAEQAGIPTITQLSEYENGKVGIGRSKYLSKLASVLRLSEADIRAINPSAVFDAVAPTRPGPPIPPVVAPLDLPLEIPDELQQVIDRHGSDYPELHNEATLRALVAPRLFAGHSQGPQTAAQWLEYFLMNRRWLPQ